MNEQYYDIEVGDVFIWKSSGESRQSRLVIEKSGDLCVIVAGNHC